MSAAATITKQQIERKKKRRNGCFADLSPNSNLRKEREAEKGKERKEKREKKREKEQWETARNCQKLFKSIGKREFNS